MDTGCYCVATDILNGSYTVLYSAPFLFGVHLDYLPTLPFIMFSSTQKIPLYIPGTWFTRLNTQEGDFPVQRVFVVLVFVNAIIYEML